MNHNLKTIIAVAGLMMTLGFGTFSGWIYTYHERFVTIEDDNAYKKEEEEYKELEKLKDELKSIDHTKEHTFILITMFELHGLSKLNEKQKAVYDRTVARFITLQARRDAITTGTEI